MASLQERITALAAAVGLDVKQMQSALTALAKQDVKVALTGTAINPADGGLFTKTISAPTTFSVSAVPASPVVTSFILELMNGGSAAVNFWPGVKWAGGTIPELTAVGKDILGFYTHDGGGSWAGLVLGKDML